MAPVLDPRTTNTNTDTEDDIPVEYIIAIVIGVFVFICACIFIVYASGKHWPCICCMACCCCCCCCETCDDECRSTSRETIPGLHEESRNTGCCDSQGAATCTARVGSDGDSCGGSNDFGENDHCGDDGDHCGGGGDCCDDGGDCDWRRWL